MSIRRPSITKKSGYKPDGSCTTTHGIWIRGSNK